MSKIKINQSFDSLSEEQQEILTALFLKADKNGFYEFEEENGKINTYRIHPKIFKEIKKLFKELKKKGFLLDDYQINASLLKEISKEQNNGN